MNYEAGKPYTIIYISKDGEEKTTEYTPDKNTNIAGIINGFKSVTPDFFKLLKIEDKEITMESKEVSTSKNLFDVLKELDNDIDIIDTDYDMMVGVSIPDEETDSYNIFINNLYKDLNVVDYNNDIAKVKLTDWVNNHKDILTDIFITNDNYAEEELVCDIMPGVISGNTADSTYNELNSRLNYTKIEESKSLEEDHQLYYDDIQEMSTEERHKLWMSEHYEDFESDDEFWDWAEEEFPVKSLNESTDVDYRKYKQPEVKIETDVDLDIPVRQYFIDLYKDSPDDMDSYLLDIKEDATFRDVIDGINIGKDIYEILGVRDSVAREYVFTALSDITGMDYDVFYYKWLCDFDEEDNLIKESVDKKFTIKVSNYFGDNEVCDWEASSEEEAVAEFLEKNPNYKNKGKVVAELKKVTESKLVEDDEDYPEELVDVDNELEDIDPEVEDDLEKDLKADGEVSSQEPTKKAVEQAIEEIDNPTEEDKLAVGVANGNLEVLLADEKAAIDGYEAFLAQAKETIPEGLYDVLVEAISEIIKDEEDHINKLNTIKESFHFDEIPLDESKSLKKEGVIPFPKESFENPLNPTSEDITIASDALQELAQYYKRWSELDYLPANFSDKKEKETITKVAELLGQASAMIKSNIES